MLKRTLQMSLLLCIALIFFTGTALAAYQNGIPVLLYHHIERVPGEDPELGVSPAAFDAQLAKLKAAGFTTISLDDFYAYMLHLPVKLPEKPLLITFDDGYEDNYTEAAPLLQKYGFQAVLFMVGVNVDRPDRLSAAQIRDMNKQGWNIAAHTMTHPDLTRLDKNSLAWELGGSKRTIERLTRQTAGFLAYPGGFYDLPVYQATQAAGYQGAFTVLTGLNNPDRDNLYLLRRIPIFKSTDFDTILTRLIANQSKASLFDYSEELPKEQQK